MEFRFLKDKPLVQKPPALSPITVLPFLVILDKKDILC